MSELSLVSQAILYVLLAAIGFFSVAILWFQVNVFRGKRMPNTSPETSVQATICLIGLPGTNWINAKLTFKIPTEVELTGIDDLAI